jgi:hypothetical protein
MAEKAPFAVFPVLWPPSRRRIVAAPAPMSFSAARVAKNAVSAAPAVFPAAFLQRQTISPDCKTL